MTRPIPRVGLLLLVGAGLASQALPAQEPAGGPGGRDTTVVAGAHYAKPGMYRFYFGKQYRELWTTPIRVELLDLDTFAGGLTPTTAGGGFQTKSLRFRGADGFQYGFRSVDKDVDILPESFAGTFVEDVVQDQTHSAHPGAPSMLAPLMEGAGIPHTDPRLVVLPDDPKLGEHRERFAGTLGYISRRAITEPGVPGFGGAVEIVDGDEIFERVQRGPADRVDARAFLYERLFDLLIGDWDRHRGQWGWARLADEEVTNWLPIPEDRDQALVRFDGLGLSLTRYYMPQFVEFGEDYPNIEGLTWNGRELDRRFLVGLEKPTWDSVTAELKFRLTDSVIDGAVRALPPEYYTLDGERLSRALKARRDKLHQAADRFYRLLAAEVDLHATDQAETVLLDRHDDGSVEVTITSTLPRSGRPTPYLRRRFHENETNEIRVFLHGGDDRALVRGRGYGITLRIVGGGSDELVDSSRVGMVHFYATGDDRVSGPTTVVVDRRPYTPPPKRWETELPPRDWGRRWQGSLWLAAGPDIGLFLGAGANVTHYAFRSLPYGSWSQVRAGYATGAKTGRFDLELDTYWSNSRVHLLTYLLASGVETLRFFGLGNETEVTRLDDYYRVSQRQVTFEQLLVLPLGRKAEIGLGPRVSYFNTREQSGRIIAGLLPYGSDKFGELGVVGAIRLDTRDLPSWPTRGWLIDLGGSVYPAVWDVEETYGEAHGIVRTYLSAPSAPLQPTLALRAGGKKVWGRFPFQQAAYIGDQETVRLGRQHRFGGDAALWGNAEVRLGLTRFFLLLPGQIGLFALGDVGRVYLEGEESNRWHWAAGGGVWLSFVGRMATTTLSVAASDERVGVYFGSGFAF